MGADTSSHPPGNCHIASRTVFSWIPFESSIRQFGLVQDCDSSCKVSIIRMTEKNYRGVLQGGSYLFLKTSRVIHRIWDLFILSHRYSGHKWNHPMRAVLFVTDIRCIVHSNMVDCEPHLWPIRPVVLYFITTLFMVSCVTYQTSCWALDNYSSHSDQRLCIRSPTDVLLPKIQSFLPTISRVLDTPFTIVIVVSRMQVVVPRPIQEFTLPLICVFVIVEGKRNIVPGRVTTVVSNTCGRNHLFLL